VRKVATIWRSQKSDFSDFSPHRGHLGLRDNDCPSPSLQVVLCGIRVIVAESDCLGPGGPTAAADRRTVLAVCQGLPKSLPGALRVGPAPGGLWPGPLASAVAAAVNCHGRISDLCKFARQPESQLRSPGDRDQITVTAPGPAGWPPGGAIELQVEA
jgi:hypothetical protein